MKTAFTPIIVVTTLLACFAAGCASDGATASETPRPPRVEPMTGSHIPNKKALPEQSDEEREKTVERMRELQKSSQPPQKLPL